MATPQQTAALLADEVLFPNAVATDLADHLPRSHLDQVAEAGLYGLFGPGEAGGMAADQAEGLAVIEALARGCLTTTFVWLHHHSALSAVANSATPGLREQWLQPMCLGKLRAAFTVSGIVRATRLPWPAPWPWGWRGGAAL
ncbi:MAG: acyl-CoA dehydrogenase family protein [Acidimicrobiales bacterium]